MHKLSHMTNCLGIDEAYIFVLQNRFLSFKPGKETIDIVEAHVSWD